MRSLEVWDLEFRVKDLAEEWAVDEIGTKISLPLCRSAPPCGFLARLAGESRKGVHWLQHGLGCAGLLEGSTPFQLTMSKVMKASPAP